MSSPVTDHRLRRRRAASRSLGARSGTTRMARRRMLRLTRRPTIGPTRMSGSSLRAKRVLARLPREVSPSSLARLRPAVRVLARLSAVQVPPVRRPSSSSRGRRVADVRVSARNSLARPPSLRSQVLWRRPRSTRPCWRLPHAAAKRQLRSRMPLPLLGRRLRTHRSGRRRLFASRIQPRRRLRLHRRSAMVSLLSRIAESGQRARRRGPSLRRLLCQSGRRPPAPVAYFSTRPAPATVMPHRRPATVVPSLALPSAGLRRQTSPSRLRRFVSSLSLVLYISLCTLPASVYKRLQLPRLFPSFLPSLALASSLFSLSSTLSSLAHPSRTVQNRT